MTPEKFNALTIDLKGQNLIEASAGTGKTFSVSLMALRLIAEENIKIDQILMVTFGEAAAAEMAERLRIFIRAALKYSYNKEHKCDEQIKAIVDNLHGKAQNPEFISQNLKEAALTLDGIQVSTIHSFCQRTLNEFAFETGQLFGMDVLPDESELIESVVNHYWRTYETIKGLEERGDRKSLRENIKENLNNDDSEIEDEIIKLLVQEIKQKKLQQSLLSYDDMIIHLSQAAQRNDKQKGKLIKHLENKYKAVFIDEFQDTDKHQFIIFSELFPNSPKFYIGDPKQSIYKFRGADLNNYLHIKEKQKLRVFSMKKNFRSAAPMLEDINSFYSILTDPFQSKNIQYQKIEPQDVQTNVVFNNEKPQALSVFYHKMKNDEKIEFIVNRVIHYLKEGRFINDENKDKVKPSDIAILTSTHKKAAELKRKLRTFGIPAITIDDTNVLTTCEAGFVKSLILLLNTPDRNLLLAVLTSKYMAYTFEDIQRIDESAEIEFITEISRNIHKTGVYPALLKLIDHYHLEERTRTKCGNEYDRMKSNVLQIVDLVHEKHTNSKMSLEHIPVWLKRQSKSSDATETAYTQRLESDDEAVKIVTVHKSKGLEFNIVILSTFKAGDFEDEFWRLLYVGLTRAKYKTDLIASSHSHHKLTYKIFRHFIEQNNLHNIFPGNPNYFEDDSFVNDFRYNDNNEGKDQKDTPPSSKPIDKSYRITSYSNIAAHSNFTPLIQDEIPENYEKFVFNDMPKGSYAGSFLHTLFEMADFCLADFTDYLTDQKKIHPKYLNQKNIPLYNQMMQQVLQADLAGFCLQNISKEKRIDELQYHISIRKKINLGELEDIVGREKVVEKKEQIQGILNGFIDLVFEHGGKYYILDWKSNYLGNSQEAYSQANMKTAIETKSYDLQYYVYALALCRILKQRVPDFSVEKHFGGGFWLFLRGCRAGLKTGVYHFGPDVEKIEALGKVFG